MVIEFLILGHFAKLMNGNDTNLLDGGVYRRYGGIFSADTTNANQSLHKLGTMSFLLAVFFLGIPLA